MPAMRVASVVAPSVLILTVVFLALGMCHKMSRYEKMRIMELESGVRTRSTSDKLFQKVRGLKECRLLAGNSVEWSTSEVHTTEVGINESCSDNRELLSSPRSLWNQQGGLGSSFEKHIYAAMGLKKWWNKI